jgi:hypothetical protein
VGNDVELLNIYHRLNDDASMGYRILGYYADGEIAIPEEEGRAKDGKSKALPLNKLGTVAGVYG